MQHELSASWLLAGIAAGGLVLASVAEAGCGDSGLAEAGEEAARIVYVPAQAYRPVSDASGQIRAHVRGLVPVVMEQDTH